MDCKRAREVVFLFVDNEMEEDLVVDFRTHLADCPLCAERIDYTLRLLAIVRERCVRERAPERLRVRILSHLPHRRRGEPPF